MGKHKNSIQIGIFIEFMEKNPDLAKGFTKRDKSLVESLWQELAASLNAAGPPTKQVNGWKKVWTEWKSEIKKKLSFNKMESRATGGGPFSKHQLTQTEETIARLCAISQAVEGVLGVPLGDSADALLESDDDMPSTSAKRTGTPNINKTPKRNKPENIPLRLSKFLDDDNYYKKETNEKINDLVNIEKENASSLRRIYRAIEKSNESVAKAVTDLKNEFLSVSSRLLTTLQEKNQIKKQQLELDLLKFDYEKQNRD